LIFNADKGQGDLRAAAQEHDVRDADRGAAEPNAPDHGHGGGEHGDAARYGFAVDIESLNNALKSKHGENEQQKQKISKLETAIQESRFQDQKIREYESRISLLAQEVKRYFFDLRLTEICRNQSLKQSVSSQQPPDAQASQQLEVLQNKYNELKQRDHNAQLKIQQMYQQ